MNEIIKKSVFIPDNKSKATLRFNFAFVASFIAISMVAFDVVNNKASVNSAVLTFVAYALVFGYIEIVFFIVNKVITTRGLKAIKSLETKIKDPSFRFTEVTVQKPNLSQRLTYKMNGRLFRYAISPNGKKVLVEYAHHPQREFSAHMYQLPGYWRPFVVEVDNIQKVKAAS